VFGNETVNPLTAPEVVLAALPGVDPARLVAFLSARATAADPKQLATSLGAAQAFVAVKPPQAVAVSLAAVVADGYAADTLAVIVCLPKDRQPYRVLSWTPVPPLSRP
jgi:general secretion pathway protein K